MSSLLTAAALALSLVLAPPRIRVLLLTGQNDHDWQFSSVTHKRTLEATGRFEVTIAADPVQALADPEKLARYDVFFLDYNGKRWGESAEKNFLSQVRSGKGVVVVHAAAGAFGGWKEYETLIGFCWRKGTGHGRFHRFDVGILDRNHPISFDLPPLARHPDELYHGLRHMHGAKHRVLMSARSARETGGSGQEEPVVMILRYGRGRVFHTSLGHVWKDQPDTHASILDPGFRLLLSRGAEWAATGRCTIQDSSTKPAAGSRSPERPRDPWVFRSALDGKPRMIVIGLDKHMWVAYDAESLGLHKVWGGTVRPSPSFQRAEQGPVAIGAPYERGPQPPAWRILRKAGDALTSLESEIHFEGYRFLRGQVHLRFRLEAGSRAVSVRETPDYLPSPRGTPGVELHRSFHVEGLEEGELLELRLGRPTARRTIQVEGAELSEQESVLRLSNGDAYLLLTYGLLEGL
ncbi:MAG: ThuA domain-containing protein [Planctomycetota bacterium]